MIIYNVTSKVSNPVTELWLQWMKDVHIPQMKETGCFTNAIILHLIEADDTDGKTFAVQFHSESRGLYNRYINTFADGMRKKSVEKWGEQVISFRSVMQVVH